ncbi:hypothetical protein D7X33_03520 [Butyricicoccus sp. 1XD8-22]|nr:hypothetical protein D7X33_03520 [Butyricicoccus sp. 1XD8-22]
MKIRKNVLWRVPAYCMAAGVVSFEILVRLLVHFKVFQPGPDGTVTTNVPLDLFIRGAVFAAAVLLGGVLLRKMTSKELFLSSTIMVAVYRLGDLLSGVSVGFGLLMAKTYEWSGSLSALADHIFHNFRAGAWLQPFAPYLFVLFGQKSPSDGTSGKENGV